MKKRDCCYYLRGGEGNRMMVWDGYKLQREIFGFFFTVETKCAFLLIILARGSSSVWQNSVKYILRVCYVVIVYTNMLSTLKGLRV